MLREECRVNLYENRVLRRIYEQKRDKMTGGWKKLHEKLHNTYLSPNIIRIIRRMRLAGYIAGGRGEMHTKLWLGSLKERDHSEDKGVDRRTILKWIIWYKCESVWFRFIWHRIGTGSGLFSPEDGDNKFLQNVGIYLRVYTASQPRRTKSSSSPP
jgi:hypothetical protein